MDEHDSSNGRNKRVILCNAKRKKGTRIDGTNDGGVETHKQRHLPTIPAGLGQVPFGSLAGNCSPAGYLNRTTSPSIRQHAPFHRILRWTRLHSVVFEFQTCSPVRGQWARSPSQFGSENKTPRIP